MKTIWMFYPVIAHFFIPSETHHCCFRNAVLLAWVWCNPFSGGCIKKHCYFLRPILREKRSLLRKKGIAEVDFYLHLPEADMAWLGRQQSYYCLAMGSVLRRGTGITNLQGNALRIKSRTITDPESSTTAHWLALGQRQYNKRAKTRKKLGNKLQLY